MDTEHPMDGVQDVGPGGRESPLDRLDRTRAGFTLLRQATGTSHHVLGDILGVKWKTVKDWEKKRDWHYPPPVDAWDALLAIAREEEAAARRAVAGAVASLPRGATVDVPCRVVGTRLYDGKRGTPTGQMNAAALLAGGMLAGLGYDVRYVWTTGPGDEAIAGAARPRLDGPGATDRPGWDGGDVRAALPHTATQADYMMLRARTGVDTVELSDLTGRPYELVLDWETNPGHRPRPEAWRYLLRARRLQDDAVVRITARARDTTPAGGTVMLPYCRNEEQLALLPRDPAAPTASRQRATMRLVVRALLDDGYRVRLAYPGADDTEDGTRNDIGKKDRS
jgi:hypothetical protein